MNAPRSSGSSASAARQQALEALVQRAVDGVRAAVAARRPRLSGAFSYGAIGLDPRHLVVWYLFSTDADKAEAERNGLGGELDRATRAALGAAGYPAAVLPRVAVCFASEAEIARGGGWAFFK